MSPRPVQRVTLFAANGTRFVFDATTTETYTHRSEITKHPVEAGFSVADHVIRATKEVHFEVCYSNTPIDGAVDNADDPNRMQRFYDEIVLAKDAATIFSIVTGAVQGTRAFTPTAFSSDLAGAPHAQRLTQMTFIQQQLENFLISEVTLRRDAKTGDAGDFTIALQQIEVANSATVRVVDASKKFAGKDGGKQDAAPADEKKPEKGKTILKNVTPDREADLTLDEAKKNREAARRRAGLTPGQAGAIEYVFTPVKK